MNRPRTVLAAVLLATVTMGLPAWSTPSSAASHLSGTATVKSYKAGIINVINTFLPANNKVIDMGTDLTKHNFKKATVDVSAAVTGIQKSKRLLDRLGVPPNGARIQTLLEQSFGYFLQGAQILRKGAQTKNVTTINTGTAIYQKGTPTLSQASQLLKKLK